MKVSKQAIVVDNHPNWREVYSEVLNREGFIVEMHSTEKAARQHLEHHRPHVALIHFREDMQRSLRFIAECATRDPTMSIVYPTYYAGPELHRRALKLGAFAVLDKTEFKFNSSDLGRTLEGAFNQCLARRQHQGGGPNIFVLMPFAERFSERYTLGVKEPLEALGVRCERVDEIDFTGNIVEKVFDSIKEASIIVADMTGRNPNVFYEVGYAHALGKPVVLLTEKVGDIPFDLKGQRHIVYGRSVVRLREGLIRTVKELLGDNLPAANTALHRTASPPKRARRQ